MKDGRRIRCIDYVEGLSKVLLWVPRPLYTLHICIRIGIRMRIRIPTQTLCICMHLLTASLTHCPAVSRETRECFIPRRGILARGATAVSTRPLQYLHETTRVYVYCTRKVGAAQKLSKEPTRLLCYIVLGPGYPKIRGLNLDPNKL